MPDLVETLCQRLGLLRDSVTLRDLPWRTWSDRPLAMTPWQAWTLLGLVRHRGRQQFVADVVRFRLNANLDSLARAGALGHPDGPQQGVVPGLSVWEYYFHGRGCCLTHRMSGEAIDVDFYDASADWFDEFFYLNYLRSLRSPTFVEEQLLRLHPSICTVRLSLVSLLPLGLLEQFEDGKIVKLAFDSEPLAGLLDVLESKWHEPGVRQGMAAALGDWSLLAAQGHSACPIDAAAKADELRAARSAELVAQFRAGRDQGDLLRALDDLQSPVLAGVIVEALRGTPSGTTSAALDAIEERNDPRWCAELVSLLHRVNPNGDIPQPSVWERCARFLLRHGQVGDLKRQIQGVTSHCLGDVALLCLEHFPEVAIATFRRALRSDIPRNRITAAAALAIVDQPWCRAELAAVLAESSDHVATAECRSALIATHCRDSHRIVEEWEGKHPRPPETGPFLSMDEMTLRMSDESIQWEMQQLHDRVIPLRARSNVSRV